MTVTSRARKIDIVSRDFLDVLLNSNIEFTFS